MKMLTSVCFLFLIAAVAHAQAPQNGAVKPGNIPATNTAAQGNSPAAQNKMPTGQPVNPQANRPASAQPATQPVAQPQGNSQRPAQPTSQPVTTQPAAQPVATTTTSAHSDSPVESILSEDLIRALRDPFQLPSAVMVRKDTPKTDLEIYPLKDFKLNGVVTGPKKTRAMVTTPSNKVFFVRVGDKMGVRDGTVTQITPDAIKITEYYTDEHGKRMPDIFELTMSGELVSLNKKEE